MTLPAKKRDADAGEHRKAFTSAKLDILDCISMDRRVTAAEFRVAFRLAQHANGENGAIFPSQDRIADQTGMKARTVRACIAGLIKKGWLHVIRPNKRVPNLYRFDGRHMNEILDRQASMDEYRKDERAARAKPFERQQDDGQTKLSGSSLPIVSGSRMPPNTLREHLKNSLGSEEEEISYARQSNGW